MQTRPRSDDRPTDRLTDRQTDRQTRRQNYHPRISYHFARCLFLFSPLYAPHSPSYFSHRHLVGSTALYTSARVQGFPKLRGPLQQWSIGREQEDFERPTTRIWTIFFTHSLHKQRIRCSLARRRLASSLVNYTG